MAYPPRRTERSWTNDDGTHFYVRTASFGDPDLPRLFHNALHSNMSASSRRTPRPASLMDGIFSVIENLSNAGSRPAARRSTPRSMPYGQRCDRFQEGPAFDLDPQTARRSSFRRSSSYADKDSDLDDMLNTEIRPRIDRSYRQRSYETSFDHDDPLCNERSLPRHQSPLRMNSEIDRAEQISRLEHAIRCEEQDIRHCNRSIRSLAHARNDPASYRQCKQLESKLREHEQRLSTLRNDLVKLTATSRRDNDYRRPEPVFPASDARPQASSRNGSRRRSALDAGDSMHFFAFSSGFAPTRSRSRGMGSPLFAEMLFEDFARFHETMTSNIFDNDVPFPAHRPQFPRTTHSYTSGPRYNRTARPDPPQATVHSTRPDLPPNLLKGEEARNLYGIYDKRWNELANTDPDIPYPTRALDARSLLARDMIFAPEIPTPVVLWTPQDTMNANIQAFFLAVNDLTPTYTLIGAKIVMGFNRRLASQEQITGLRDMLKKEKMRWHSDRLGRRNNGNDGINEALQCNEQARAVFHAVCELKELATAA